MAVFGTCLVEKRVAWLVGFLSGVGCKGVLVMENGWMGGGARVQVGRRRATGFEWWSSSESLSVLLSCARPGMSAHASSGGGGGSGLISSTRDGRSSHVSSCITEGGVVEVVDSEQVVSNGVSLLAALGTRLLQTLLSTFVTRLQCPWDGGGGGGLRGLGLKHSSVGRSSRGKRDSLGFVGGGGG